MQQVRTQKWRVALGQLCGQLKLQSGIRDGALRLVQHMGRFRGSKESRFRGRHMDFTS